MTAPTQQRVAHCRLRRWRGGWFGWVKYQSYNDLKEGDTNLWIFEIIMARLGLKPGDFAPDAKSLTVAQKLHPRGIQRTKPWLN